MTEGFASKAKKMAMGLMRLPGSGSKVDLHNHSYYSDGTKSPEEVIARGAKMGLAVMALSDHDGIDGLKEALAAGEKYGVRVIPAVEFSTETEEGIGLHILGYDFDMENEELIAACEDMRKRRKERNEKLIELLNKEGYDISYDDLTKPVGDYVGKPDLARAMVRKGYIATKDQAFTDIFSKAEYRAIKKVKISAGDAVEIIKNAGGIPVLAHPGLIKHIGERESEEFKDNLEEIIESLKARGLKGLECIYPKHSQAEEEFFGVVAANYSLSKTRGSDYHGD